MQIPGNGLSLQCPNEDRRAWEPGRTVCKTRLFLLSARYFWDGKAHLHTAFFKLAPHARRPQNNRAFLLVKMEVFKNILNYDNYQIGDNGSVINSKTGRILRPGISSQAGYLMVILSKNGVKKNHYIHRLVAEYFVNNPNNYNMVIHKDSNPLNNSVSNLEWTLPEKRIRGLSKLTKEQVKEIREQLLSGSKMMKIAKEFSISKDTVRRIANNHIWKNI